jgi:hypothetical protein
VRLLEVGVVLGALLSRRPLHRLPPGVDADDLAAGYERSDMRPAVVLGGAAALLVILLLVLILITSFEAAVTGVPFTIGQPRDLIQGLQAAPAPTPPAPRLEAQSGETLDPYRAAAEQKLDHYHWVNRQAGIAGIPVEQAMDLLAQQGLPARPTPTGTTTPARGNTAPSNASSGRVPEAYP